jgi:uncharacterized Zn finger protein
LQTSKFAITDTLAKNCPNLEEINGTNDSVRYIRNPITSKFQPCDDTNSTVDYDELVAGLQMIAFDLDVDDYENYDVDDDEFAVLSGEENEVDDLILDELEASGDENDDLDLICEMEQNEYDQLDEFLTEFDDYDYDNDYLFERLHEEMMD